MMYLKILLYCFFLTAVHGVQASADFSIKELNKCIYGLEEPSNETLEVANQALKNLGVAGMEVLQYPFDQIASAALGRFTLALPDFSQLSEPQRSFEIFNLYRELNRKIQKNSLEYIAVATGFIYSLLWLPLVGPCLYPYFLLDLQIAIKHVRYGGDIASAVTRSKISLLLSALWMASGIASWSAFLKVLCLPNAQLEQILDCGATKNLKAYAPEILEQAIDYVAKNNSTQGEISRLQLPCLDHRPPTGLEANLRKGLAGKKAKGASASDINPH